MDLKPSSLGVAAGVSKSTIQKWIDASYSPHFSPAADKLKLVADYCGVTVDWLLDRGPFEAGPAYEPTRMELHAVRSRLLRRRYPLDAVNDVLLSTDFTSARNDNDVFDLAERELSRRGLSANFWGSVAEPAASVTFAEGRAPAGGYAHARQLEQTGPISHSVSVSGERLEAPTQTKKTPTPPRQSRKRSTASD